MNITRYNQSIFYRSFQGPYISAVLGPRRVGKSTLVQAFSQTHSDRDWVFLNMDDRAERLRIEAMQLAAILEERARRKIDPHRPLWVSIDEAQKCPALFDQIKILYDRYKGSTAIKFILTGSAFLTLHQLAAESLAGRIELLRLREFGLREAAALRSVPAPEGMQFFKCLETAEPLAQLQDLITALSPHRPVLEKCLQGLWIWGGLPEVLQIPGENPEARISYLSNYLQTYLERDIRDIGTLTDLGLYQRMMEVLAQQTGSVREEKRLQEVLGCARDTLKKYRGALEATLFYRELYPYIRSTLKRLVKSPKGYLNDNGLVSYLTGIYDLNALEKTGAIGHRMENWVLQELQIWLDGDPRKSELYYWRTTGNVEVDMVVVKEPRVYPIEVTYSTLIDRKKVKHLRLFLREEKKAPFGIYLYQGDFAFDREARIVFWPAWALG